MCHKSLTALCLILAMTTESPARDLNREVLQAQIAAVLASVDYTAENCPSLHVDQGKLAALIERSGKTEEQLRATGQFIEQREIIEELADNQSVETLCWVLHQVHGGYVRGVILKQ